MPNILSTIDRQANFLAGFTPFYPMFMPGAVTWFVAPAGYTPGGGGLGDTTQRMSATGLSFSSDTNSGELPQAALATLGQAMTNAVAGRGDTIVLLPGTYTFTATIAVAKSALRIVSLLPYAATLTGDGVITTLMTVNANDVELAGLRFAQTAAMTTGVQLANTAVTSRTFIHHCRFIGGSVAASTGLVNGQNQAGNDAIETAVQWCVFANWSAQGMITYGGRCEVTDSRFQLSTAGGATGLTVGDQGAAFTRDYLNIERCKFIGGSDASALLGVTFAGIQANTQIWCMDTCTFASCAAPGTAPHPQGGALNYVGTPVGNPPTLWAP